jgi:hypothetical protein
LASSPIRKHTRYALSKLFMIGNQAVQKQHQIGEIIYNNTTFKIQDTLPSLWWQWCSIHTGTQFFPTFVVTLATIHRRI